MDAAGRHHPVLAPYRPLRPPASCSSRSRVGWTSQRRHFHSAPGTATSGGMGRFLAAIRRVLVALGVAVLFVAAAIAGLLWLSLPRAAQDAAIPGIRHRSRSASTRTGFPASRPPPRRMRPRRSATCMRATDCFRWSMMRRNASGRLSEIAGTATLPIDRHDAGARPAPPRAGRSRNAARRHARDAGGLRARRERLDRGARALQRTGIRGARRARALESGRQPALGQDDGALAIENWRMELGRLSLAGRLPPRSRSTSSGQPDRQDGHPDARRRARSPLRRRGTAGFGASLPALPRALHPAAAASNEWAVDGRHTATGAPLLAGDPHLGSASPASGTWRGSKRRAACWPARPRPACRSWCWATTAASPGPSPPRAPTCRTCSSRRRPAMAVPDPRRPAPVHGARGADRRPRQAGRAAEGARDPARPGDQRPRRGGGPVLAVAMANLQPGDTAAAGLLALNRAKDVDEAGLAAAGSPRRCRTCWSPTPAYRALRHRPGADPPGRRRRGAGRGRGRSA